jgi:hypothetical protein
VLDSAYAMIALHANIQVNAEGTTMAKARALLLGLEPETVDWHSRGCAALDLERVPAPSCIVAAKQ